MFSVRQLVSFSINMLHLLVTVSMLRVSVRSFSQVKNIRPASLESPMDVLSLFFTNFNLLNERSFDLYTLAVARGRIICGY